MTAKKYEGLSSPDANVKEKAFEAFYLELRGNFIARNWTRICKFLTKREDKEEIYQSSMKSFWGKISTNIFLENPKGYFVSLAKGIILNWCRKQANINQHLSDLVYESSSTFSAEDIEAFMSKDLVEKAIYVLEQENPKYAQYILWYFINELDYKEIQALMLKQTGKEVLYESVKNDVWRAKTKMREIIRGLSTQTAS